MSQESRQTSPHRPELQNSTWPLFSLSPLTSLASLSVYYESVNKTINVILAIFVSFCVVQKAPASSEKSFISSAVQSIQYYGSILVHYLRNITNDSLRFCMWEIRASYSLIYNRAETYDRTQAVQSELATHNSNISISPIIVAHSSPPPTNTVLHRDGLLWHWSCLHQPVAHHHHHNLGD